MRCSPPWPLRRADGSIRSTFGPSRCPSSRCEEVGPSWPHGRCRGQLATGSPARTRKRADRRRNSFRGFRILARVFVGAGRFELPTSRTRTVRATKLRYAPPPAGTGRARENDRERELSQDKPRSAAEARATVVIARALAPAGQVSPCWPCASSDPPPALAPPGTSRRRGRSRRAGRWAPRRPC